MSDRLSDSIIISLISLKRLDIWLRRAKGSNLLSTIEDSSSDLMGSFLFAPLKPSEIATLREIENSLL